MDTNLVSTLQIEGFKCFIKKEITFNKLTILAGGNSVGKSTTIQALLLSRSVCDITREKLTKGFKWSRKLDIRVPLNGEYLLSLGNSEQIRNSKGKSICFIFWERNKNCAFGVPFVDESQPELSLHCPSFWYQDAKKSPEYIKSVSLWQDSFHYLNAERLGPRNIYDMEAQRFLNVGYQGTYSVQILGQRGQTFKVDADRSFEKQEDLRLREQTQEWMKYVIPDIDIEAKIYEQLNKAQVNYNSHSPFNVGFGISYILPIIVSGLIAEKGSMLIVENPEAHLHPFGQSQIGKFLAVVANSGVQVIIETHSEHVINGIRLASLEKIIDHENVTINFFSQQKDSVEPKIDEIRLNSKADLSDWPIGFFDQQEQDLAKIFRYRRGKV